jgi:hypothetical protein
MLQVFTVMEIIKYDHKIHDKAHKLTIVEKEINILSNAK